MNSELNDLLPSSCAAAYRDTDSELPKCVYTKPVADLRGRVPRAPPEGPKFFQFHAVFGKIWQNRMLAPPLGSWRPLPGEILDPPLQAKVNVKFLARFDALVLRFLIVSIEKLTAIESVTNFVFKRLFSSYYVNEPLVITLKDLFPRIKIKGRSRYFFAICDNVSTHFWRSHNRIFKHVPYCIYVIKVIKPLNTTRKIKKCDFIAACRCLYTYREDRCLKIVLWRF